MSVQSFQIKKKKKIKARRGVIYILKLTFGTKPNSSSAEPVECSGVKYFQAVDLKKLL